MSTDPLRVAVAGLGEIGLMHAANVERSDDCQLVAIGSTQPERARVTANELGLTADLLSYDELFARSDVDAVVITSRSPEHPRHVVSALTTGKHAFVEKPAATSADDHEAIMRAQADHPELVLQVGYQRRFDPAFRELRRSVDDGLIGQPLVIELVSRENFPPVPGEAPGAKGGLLVDIGVHDFDSACWILDDEPLRCYAAGSSLRYPELAEVGDVDTAVVTIEFARGALAHVHLSRASVVGHEISCELYGTNGSAHLRAAPLRAAVRRIDAADSDQFPVDYRDRFETAFQAQLSEFVRVCRGESGALPGADDDRRAVAIALAARRSLTSGRAMPIEAHAVARDDTGAFP